jgi:hypothetical protein
MPVLISLPNSNHDNCIELPKKNLKPAKLFNIADSKQFATTKAAYDAQSQFMYYLDVNQWPFCVA